MKEPQLLYKGKYRIPSARLPYHDYSSAGLYFVTINALNHRNLFGSIMGETVHRSELGELVDECWQDIPAHFPRVELDYYQIMPNHFHGILLLTGDGNSGSTVAGSLRTPGGLQAGSLSIIINSFKGAVTYRARSRGLSSKVWQPRFHDHVIRSERALEEIRYYIVNNPARWAEDRYFNPG